jgi:amino acid adenylation domain-containing protein
VNIILDKHCKENSLTALLFDNYEESKFFSAIRIEEEDMSYEDLYNKALKLAAILKENDVYNETVAIVGHRNFSTYISILGILFAGCNYTPINPKDAKSKILEILSESKVNYLVGDYLSISKLQDKLKNNDLVGKSIITPLCYVKDKEAQRWMDKTDVDKIDPLLNPMDSDDSHLAYVLYTSGSTGKPKGVKVTRRNVFSYLKATSQLWNIPSRFRMSQFHDLSFDPSVSDIFYTFCNKGTLCVVPENEMTFPSDFIIREKLDIWSSVPSISTFMLKMGALSDGKYPHLKIIRHAGEPFPVALAKSWQSAAPNASVENHYGPTEATIDVSRHLYDSNYKYSDCKNNIMPIGKPFPNIKIAIVNDDLEKIVDKNLQGEIVFCGPQVSNGYLNDQYKTDEYFVRFFWDNFKEIWYKSGDLGFINNSGDIECAGRKDSQIKIGGRRIEIGEIEAVLSHFDITREAVVVPIRDDSEIVTGCAAFVLTKLSSLDVREIRKQSTELMDSIFFPKKIFFIKDFPRSQSGKINRKTLEKSAKELINLENDF